MSPSTLAPPRSWRHRVTTYVALLLMLGAALAVAWWWRHPTAFQPGLGHRLGQDPALTGRALYVGISEPGSGGPATIHGVRAADVVDTAQTRVDYLICTHRPGLEMGSAYESEVTEVCLDVAPAEGARIDPVSQQVVAVITPTRQGSFTARGFAISYSSGWQRGSQRIGPVLELSAAP